MLIKIDWKEYKAYYAENYPERRFALDEHAETIIKSRGATHTEIAQPETLRGAYVPNQFVQLIEG